MHKHEILFVNACSSVYGSCKMFSQFTGCEFSEALVKRVQAQVRQSLSARHVPQLVLQTSDIPVSTSTGVWTTSGQYVSRCPDTFRQYVNRCPDKFRSVRQQVSVCYKMLVCFVKSLELTRDLFFSVHTFGQESGSGSEAYTSRR